MSKFFVKIEKLSKLFAVKVYFGMTKKIFITGTGTDIGKTYVSALIVKEMREAGYNCGYYKPVLSGVRASCGKLFESDCNYVIDFSKIPISPDECVSFWWEEAVSPHLASVRAGQKIDIGKIKNDFNKICTKFDYILIEGAGGITCPLILDNNEKYLMKDLIKELNCSVVIVADGGLGTINSTLLTVEYAINNDIPIEGIILNNYDKNSFMHKDNLKQTEFLTNKKILTVVEKNQKNIAFSEKYFK